MSNKKPPVYFKADHLSRTHLTPEQLEKVVKTRVSNDQWTHVIRAPSKRKRKGRLTMIDDDGGRHVLHTEIRDHYGFDEILHNVKYAIKFKPDDDKINRITAIAWIIDD